VLSKANEIRAAEGSRRAEIVEGFLPID